jgi:hypothetical protein
MERTDLAGAGSFLLTAVGQNLPRIASRGR